MIGRLRGSPGPQRAERRAAAIDVEEIAEHRDRLRLALVHDDLQAAGEDALHRGGRR